jgi:hypothetical protein
MHIIILPAEAAARHSQCGRTSPTRAHDWRAPGGFALELDLEHRQRGPPKPMRSAQQRKHNPTRETQRGRKEGATEGVLLPFACRWFPGKEQAPSGSLGGLLVLQVEVEQPDNVDALPALKAG